MYTGGSLGNFIFRKDTRMRAIILAGLLVAPSLAAAGQNVLSWVDNSNNEANFLIERSTATNVAGCATAVAWAQIVTVGPNVITFTDTAVDEGTVYCYRVRAANSAGSSAYSNAVGRLVPFTIPAAPGNLQVGP